MRLPLPQALTLVAALASALAACGPSTPEAPPPPGTVVEPTARSTVPSIARIQEYIERRLQLRDPEAGGVDKSRPDWKSRLPLRPSVDPFDPSKAFLWLLETDAGTLQIRLHPDKAPQHVTNIVYMTLLGVYDGLAIHTIRPGQALESGDPADDGKGGTGAAFSPEPGAGAHDRRGLVSAVSLGASTDDSKFRIAFAPLPDLDPVNTVFGHVEAGLDVLGKLEALGTPTGRPTSHTTIRRAQIAVR